MKKFLLALGVFALSGVGAFAQTDDYKKGEVFVGYSHQRVDMGVSGEDNLGDFISEREGFNGFNVSGVYNVSRYVGLKADVSGAYKGRSYSIALPGTVPQVGASFDTDMSLYNFLGGVQFKDNSSDARVKPFAHMLAGAGHGRLKISNVNCTSAPACAGIAGTSSETGLAGAFGGGIDIKLSNRVDFRAIQVDYNPMRLDGQTTHNVRFGIGLVFR